MEDDHGATPAASFHGRPATPFDPQALAGQVAVVTGASGGLGIAICRQLHDAGATVVRLDLAYGAEPPAEADGARLLSLCCDIADPASVQSMAGQVRERFGRCDLLVNNAGITAPQVPLEDFPIAHWDRVFGVNLRGALLCAQALVPLMFARGEGSIVNVASIAARSPSRSGAYGPAKAGLLGLTRQMAVEWGPRGVRANAVSPGLVLTPLSEPHYRDAAKRELRVSRIPVRRIGVPGDIAGAVLFLASSASAYVNGQDLVVDGGFLTTGLSSLY